MNLRVYLTGRVRLEAGDVLVDEPDLPGRQGRLLLAMLAAERDRALSRHELAEELWGEALPPAWESGLKALLSKLRRSLVPSGLGGDALRHSFGCYQLVLPGDTWVDVEAAADAIHRAEAALAAADARTAYGWTYVAYHVARRPFLPGEDGPWAERRRAGLRDLRLRALDCAVAVSAANGDMGEAVQAAEDALALAPLRESTYQQLMRALAGAGSRAEALRVYERCRRVLADELGVSPSPETEAVYLDILGR